jgi:predicted nucleic acid-binding protein
MSAYLIDSDVIIWVLRKRTATVDWLEDLAATGSLACSVLTVTEILRGARTAELPTTRALLNAFDMIPVTCEDAVKAAEIMRDRGPGLVDSLIAAAALRLGNPVVTYNQRDYARTGVSCLVPPPQ